MGCAFQTAKAETTNVVMVANISLTGFRSGTGSSAASVRLSTKDILADLNAKDNFNFGRNAQLVLMSQDDQLPTFAVREKTGTNVTTTDISSFLSISEATEVHGGNTSYAAQTFNFDDQKGTTFSVSGFTTLHRGRINSRGIGPLDRAVSLSAQLGGYGTINGEDMVLRGTVTGGSAKAEVD